MSTRVTAAAEFVTDDGIAVTTATRVLGVSRQAVYDRLAPAGQADEALVEDQDDAEAGVALRLVPPVLPENWPTMPLGPGECDVETAIHVLALRHPAAGHHKVTARARRAGYVLNRKKTARLLNESGFLQSGKKPHPKAQGKPFDITATNQFGQTDMTSIWCCQDEWGYFTAVIHTFDQALAAIMAWIQDYNTERPHASLGEPASAEARAEAAQDKAA